MRYLLLAFLLFSIGFDGISQLNPPYYPARQDSLIQRWLGEFDTNTKRFYNPNERYLVTTYTFRRLAQNDFASIIIGENGFSKIGRYATLNINVDESRFYFSPITFIHHQDPFDGPFKAIHSIELSGEVNDGNIFNLSSKNTLKGGYSYTRVYNYYNFYPKSRDTLFHDQMIKIVYDKWKGKYQKAYTDFAEFLSLAEDLDTTDFSRKGKRRIQNAFFKDLYAIEVNYYNDKWTRKRIDWLKVNLSPLGWSNFTIIDPDHVATQVAPIDKSIYAPSVRVSYNFLWTYPQSGHQLYLSAWVGGAQKHSLSEISNPVQWYQFQKINDTTFTVSDEKKVYSIRESALLKRIRPDAGLQFIYLFEVAQKFSMGVDLASSFSGLVTPDGGAFINRSSFGLLFPFQDKNGEASINFELFYQLKSFTKMEMNRSDLLGIKFGLPFNRL
jgi:hypothetical protein